MKTLVSAGLVAILIALVSGCNTISGAGRDVSSGANAVQHSIQNN